MTLLPSILVIVAACYLIGGIPFGFLMGKAKGIDIRDHGSGNIGATNVLRTCGKAAGLICFLLDALKGFLPVAFVIHLAGPDVVRAIEIMDSSPRITLNEYSPLIAVFATVSGHIWTPYLRFRGGKGIATSAGALLAVSPIPVVVGLVLWAIVVATTKYVSLASIVAAASLPITGIVTSDVPAGEMTSDPVLILLFGLAFVAIVRHRSNIQRLLSGTENRIGTKKEPE